jgi:predicted aconitase with swiveling domain
MLMAACDIDVQPKAFLFANHIDSLASCGLLMADIWLGKRIVTVDMLGDEFLDAVKTGDKIKVYEDGTVEIED